MNLVLGFHNPLSCRSIDSYSYMECKQWASVLNAEVHCTYSDSDNIYLYLGTNYEPGDENNPKNLNMFGGFQEKYYRTLEQFLNTEANFYTINHKIPPKFLADIIRRAEIKTPSTFIDANVEICKAIADKAKNITSIVPEDFVTDSLMVGDSHSYSMSPFGVPCLKLMAQTLNGSLKRKQFKEWAKTKATKMYFMLGSVDIQFHIFRQENPWLALEDLVNRYINELKELVLLGKTIEICSPVPITAEDRKLTKSTVYKGSHFYGSVEDRTEATLKFIELAKKLTEDIPEISVFTYPMEWYTEDRLIYNHRLEKNAGHHIRYKFSRMNNFGADIW